MKNFDPLKTRAEQGLSALPSWQFSLSEQRSLLASRGLKQGAWTTEKIEGHCGCSECKAHKWLDIETISLEEWLELHSVTETIDWHVVEETDEPTLIQGVDVRGDRKTFENGINYVEAFDPTPYKDEVTAREQEADNIRIGSRLKVVHEYVTRVK